MVTAERSGVRSESHEPNVPVDGGVSSIGSSSRLGCLESTPPPKTGYDMGMTLFDAMFDGDPILPADPDDLEVLHEREYRVRAYRISPDDASGDGLLIRGGVRDQKPADLYRAQAPDPLTIHHMQVELRPHTGGARAAVGGHAEQLSHLGRRRRPRALASVTWCTRDSAG